MPKPRPIHVKRPLTLRDIVSQTYLFRNMAGTHVATSDKTVSTLARICPTTIKPKMGPWLNAWRAFSGFFLSSSLPRSIVTRPRVTGSSVSGMRILLIAIEAGMLMTAEVTKVCGGTPRLMYATMTDPAMVEKPEVMATSYHEYDIRVEKCET